jgi:hypothetical protein
MIHEWSELYKEGEKVKTNKFRKQTHVFIGLLFKNYAYFPF